MSWDWGMFLKIAGLIVLWVVIDKIGDFLLGIWSTDNGSIPGTMLRVGLFVAIFGMYLLLTR